MWSECGLPGEPPRLRHAVLRELAWAKQGGHRGLLDAETKRLLKRAIRDAPRPGTQAPSRARKRRGSQRLEPGTRLVRTWRGRAHEVEVGASGQVFRYRGREYGSLSEIAREITGARWSGPRFFGLTKADVGSRRRAG
ncbi:MAG: DUF2924 domain-containing protein [Planctomycetota bacterium]